MTKDSVQVPIRIRDAWHGDASSRISRRCSLILTKTVSLEFPAADIYAGRGAVQGLPGGISAGSESRYLAVRAQLNPTNRTGRCGQPGVFVKQTRRFGRRPLSCTPSVQLPPRTAAPESADGHRPYFKTICIRNCAQPSGKLSREAIELDPKLYYPRFSLWLIRTRLGERPEATQELKANIKLREGEEGHEWQLCIARSLVGPGLVWQANFLAQAVSTRPAATQSAGQQCGGGPGVHASMKRLLDGDEPGAISLLLNNVSVKIIRTTTWNTSAPWRDCGTQKAAVFHSGKTFMSY